MRTPRRIAEPQLAFTDQLARRNHRAGANHAVPADDDAVEHGRVHADQAGVHDRAGVHDGAVADGDVGADGQRETARRVVAVVGHVQDRTVLDIAARADADGVHVAARDRERP